MKQNLIRNNYIHADETPVKVIDSKGKESKSKHYMWVYVSDREENSIILYDYQKTRSSSCPVNFLKGFSGYLQTDGYSGYNKVEHVKRLYCLAHIRRKFFDIITELNGEALKQSRAIIGFNYCEKLYSIEKDLREQYSGSDNYYDDRHRIRLEKSLPIFNEFQNYIDTEIPDALPASALGKALSYTQKLLPTMKAFFTDGSLDIDNNAALYLEYYYPHFFIKTLYIAIFKLKDEDYIFYLNPQSLANSSSSPNHSGSSSGILGALRSIADLSISKDGVA